MANKDATTAPKKSNIAEGADKAPEANVPTPPEGQQEGAANPPEDTRAPEPETDPCATVGGCINSRRREGPEEKICSEAAERAWRQTTLAVEFAKAILENPAVDRMLYGSPLDTRKCQDRPNVGTFLAECSLRLAKDFEDALRPLVETNRQDFVDKALADLNSKPADLGEHT